MEIDPLSTVESIDENTSSDIALVRLNMLIAITVAILATFMGICKAKDDNIVQEMQRAQANKLDRWAFYQARNIREEIAKSTFAQLRLAAMARPATEQEAYQLTIKEYENISVEQSKKKAELQALAEQDQKDYDAANFKDNQFDLSDTLIAIAIAMLAVTALTHQKWLYWAALIPTFGGFFMGLSGLLAWPFHPDIVIRLLS